MTAFAPLPDKLTEELQVVRNWIQGNPREALEAINAMEDLEVRESLLKNWELWRRDGQPRLDLADIPEQYDQVLLLCGRAWGKSRWTMELLRRMANKYPGAHIGVLGKAREDIKKTLYEGPAGLFSCMTDEERKSVHYDKVTLELNFPNGTRVHAISADRPDKLRGHNLDFAISDELVKYQYPDEVLEQLNMSVRRGSRPLKIFATTPKPTKAIKELAADPRTLVITGPSFDNHFLVPSFFENMKRTLTARLYRQEVLGEVLSDAPGALFKHSDIERARLRNMMAVPPLDRIVVAVDPAVTSNENSDETGIVVVGCADVNGVRHFYVLADSSVRGALPREWAAKAVSAYDTHMANYIVAEVNQGGDMVTATIQSVRESVPCKTVRATRGKAIRAEPISALYEQGRVHHVGVFDELESQMTEWDPSLHRISPDRLDATVWGVTQLMGDGAEFNLRSL